MLDVLIIGGGVVGTAIARELSKYELNTLLLEKEVEIGMGVTKANSGIVHAGHDCKPGTLKAKLNVRGNELYTELAEELGFLFRRNGAFVLAFSEAEIAKLEKLKEQGITNGVPGLEILNREQVLALEPTVNPQVVAALYAPTSGLVFGPELATALAESASRNGVQFKLNTAVTNIKKVNDYYLVKTAGEVYQTKMVINAAGLFSDEMNNFVNAQKYEITPRKGEYYLLDTAAKQIVDKTIFQLPTEKGKGVLVLPTVHDNILVGPSSEFVDSKTDVSTNGDVLAAIKEQAKKSVENVPLHLTITTFTGLRAKEKHSEDFIIEEKAGFINTVGIESPGLTAAPAIGEYVAAIVIEQLNPAVNEAFVAKLDALPLFKTLPVEKQKELISINPAYGRIVCRCEKITEADVVNTIRKPFGATTLDGLKFKSRAGSGRCQAGFCTPKLIEILARERKIHPFEVTKRGNGSTLLVAEEEVASL